MSATGMTLDSGLLGQRDRVSRTLRRTTRIGFAMLALVLMDQALRHRAQCGDVGEVSPRIPGTTE